MNASPTLSLGLFCTGSELFLCGTSAHIWLFSARKWCENVIKEKI